MGVQMGAQLGNERMRLLQRNRKMSDLQRHVLRNLLIADAAPIFPFDRRRLQVELHRVEVLVAEFGAFFIGSKKLQKNFIKTR